MNKITYNNIVSYLSKTKVQIFILLLLSILAYINILGNGISYDDRDFLLNWPAVRDSKNGLSAFLSFPDLLAGDLPSHHQGVYRPIRSIYYLLSLKIWGFQPFFFHLQAIIVHTLIVVFVYFTVRALSKKTFPAFATAVLFALHPIHTEAVTYTSASFDTLGIMFFFASFYFYVRSRLERSQKQSSLLLSILLAFLAFFTYEMTLTLPLLIIFYEIIFNKLGTKNIFKFTDSITPFFLLLVLYGIVRVFLVKIGTRADYLGTLYQVASNQAKIASPEILLLYIRKLLFPFDLTVANDLPINVFNVFVKAVEATGRAEIVFNTAEKMAFLVPLSLILILLLIAVKILKNYPLTAFGIGWFAISLLPVLNILPQGTTVAERFLYIPSFGFCLVLGWLIYKIPDINFTLPKKAAQFLAVITFVSVCSLYMYLTITRNNDWRTEETIFLSALKIDPTSYIGNGALGTMMLDQQRYSEAVNYFKKALDTAPYAFRTRHQLGLAYEKQNMLQDAEREYKEALKTDTKYYFANLGLGSVYRQQGKYTEALKEYQQVLEIVPDNFEARFNLAGMYLRLENLDEALKNYQLALNITPSYPQIYSNLAYIYEKQGDTEKAINAYNKSLELEPLNYYNNLNLGLLYQKNNQPKLSLEYFKKALSIRSQNKELENRIKALELSY